MSESDDDLPLGERFRELRQKRASLVRDRDSAASEQDRRAVTERLRQLDEELDRLELAIELERQQDA